MKFEASMHGIDIDKAEKEAHDVAAQPMLFGDPKDYEKLSEEEREERTKEMMMYHKGWVSRSSIKGG